MKDKIAFWYKNNLWTIDMVRNAVSKEKISIEDFEEITRELYY